MVQHVWLSGQWEIKGIIGKRIIGTKRRLESRTRPDWPASRFSGKEFEPDAVDSREGTT